MIVRDVTNILQVSRRTCYDEKLDPKGEEYKGFANTTESGRTCQVTQEGLKKMLI